MSNTPVKAGLKAGAFQVKKTREGPRYRGEGPLTSKKKGKRRVGGVRGQPFRSSEIGSGKDKIETGPKRKKIKVKSQKGRHEEWSGKQKQQPIWGEKSQAKWQGRNRERGLTSS